MIYQVDSNLALYEKKIYPMFDAVYEKLLSELRAGNKDSIIYTHHLDYVRQYAKYYQEYPSMNRRIWMILWWISLPA